MGWPQTLSNLYTQLDAKPKNYFILISRIPSIPVDFRSTEGMHNSINSLTFQRDFHPGHEMMGWKCRIDTIPFTTLIGLTGESSDQHTQMLDAGWGLSSLLATFKDGFIQPPGELESRFKFFAEENVKAETDKKIKKIQLIATVIEISQTDCENLVNESFEFINHPNNPSEYFSMILSPTRYEGAGCGSFAAHFIERVESLKNVTPPMRRQFQLPNYLFGTGTDLPEGVEIPDIITKVALTKPLSKLKMMASSWSPSAATPNVDVEILDPELLVFWQKLFFDAYFDQHNMTKEKKAFNKNYARGIWEHQQDLYNSDQINTRYLAIDKSYDGRTKQISNLHANLAKDKQLTYFTFLNFPGVILENIHGRVHETNY